MSYLTSKVNSAHSTNQNINVNLTDLITGTPSNTNIFGYTGNNYAPLALNGLAHDYGDAVFNWNSPGVYSTGALVLSANDLLSYYTSGIMNYDALIAANATYSIGAYSGWYMAIRQPNSVGKTLLLESTYSSEALSGSTYTIQWQAGSDVANLSPIGPKTYCDEESCAVAYGIYTVPDASTCTFALVITAITGTVRVLHMNNFLLTSFNVRSIS